MPRPKGTPKTGGRTKGSRNKVGRDIRELARAHSPAAISVLVDVMGDSRAAPAARVLAANTVLVWAHGKPPQAIPVPEAPIQTINLEIMRQQIRAKLERIAAAREEATAGRLIEGTCHEEGRQP